MKRFKKLEEEKITQHNRIKDIGAQLQRQKQKRKESA